MSSKTGGKKRPINKGSALLTPDENEALFRLLGHNNYTLSTGVVQLLAADIPSSREWQKKLVGVLCFIKDYNDKGYFLRIYDIIKHSMVWEQELYDGFYVRQKTEENAPELVTFEGDYFVYGLNFSSKDEATHFSEQIRKRLEQELNKRTYGETDTISPSSGNQRQSSTTSPIILTSGNNLTSPSLNLGATPVNKRQKKGKQKLTKKDIGLPTNFEHRVHVGWDSSKGFQTQVDDDDLDGSVQKLLDAVGFSVRVEQLNKKDLREVYQIVEQFGGLDAVKSELKQRSHPEAKPQAPRAPPQVSVTPQPPTRVRDLPTLPKSAPSRPGPPPPPPGTLTNVATTGVAPPAPPPPPPPPTGVATAPAAPPPPPIVAGGGRQDLLTQIAKGVALKPPGAADAAKPAAPPESRDAMLRDIKEGVALRRVDRQEKQRVTPPEDMGGIAGALAKALQERRFQLTTEDSDSADDEGNGDDEWED